jgi:hypothetical protein
MRSSISDGPLVLVVVGCHERFVDALDGHLTAKNTGDLLASYS